MAMIAPKDIVAGLTRNGAQTGARTVPDPARGALIVSSERDLEIRRALNRAARRLKFHFLIRRERLRVQIFLMDTRCALLRLRSQFTGHFK
jgi:hypothetical protein